MYIDNHRTSIIAPISDGGALGGIDHAELIVQSVIGAIAASGTTLTLVAKFKLGLLHIQRNQTRTNGAALRSMLNQNALVDPAQSWQFVWCLS